MKNTLLSLALIGLAAHASAGSVVFGGSIVIQSPNAQIIISTPAPRHPPMVIHQPQPVVIFPPVFMHQPGAVFVPPPLTGTCLQHPYHDRFGRLLGFTISCH